MTLGFPLGLLALTALIPLTAAYFLRRRQKPRTVSALFLWRTESQRAQAGPRFQRYVRELSFLLEVLAIVAAALFLADLRFGGSIEDKHLVLVVDGSLSMSARPPSGEPVVERAKDAAARIVERERAPLVSIVESGPHPRVLAGPAVEASKALAALEAWRPLAPSHDVMPALLLAEELSGGKRRIHLVTDGPLPEGLELPANVQLTAVGQAAENVAIVSAQRRDEGEVATVAVRLSSFGASARRVSVRFDGPAADAARPGGARKTEEVELAPGGTAVVRASFRNAGPIEVRLPDDALVEDGRVTLLPSPLPALAVGVSGGLGAAAQPVQRFLDVAPGARAAGPDERPTLTFGPRDSSAEVRIGATGALRTFIGPFFAQKDHPLLDDVQLGGVLWTAGDNPPGRPLATAGDAVLISEEDDGTVWLNLELGRSNVQRTAAWPVLLGNIVRRARQQLPGLPKRHLMLGEDVPVVTEPGARYVLDGPGGKRPILGSGAVLLPPLSPPGRYTLLRDGEPVDALVVLPIDPRESDLRGRAELSVEAKSAEGLSSAALRRGRSIWPVLLLLVLLLVDFWLTSTPLRQGEGMQATAPLRSR